MISYNERNSIPQQKREISSQLHQLRIDLERGRQLSQEEVIQLIKDFENFVDHVRVIVP